ncbi:MAG: hypothetical protein J6A89_02475 [Clostridia bacterium]|nr:hypothetical protein [Clostridia bacterium]
MGNMRNIIRLKDVPSNTIEEAIIIFKDNKKAKKYEYTNKFKNENEKNKDNQNYVIKEAELIISDYLKNSESDDSDIKKKNKRLKLTNIILGFLLIVSIIF